MYPDVTLIESRIRREIVDGLGYEAPLEAGQSLRHAAVFDSSNVLEFVMFLEDEFGIKVESDDMVLDTFESIDNLVAFVADKQRSAAA